MILSWADSFCLPPGFADSSVLQHFKAYKLCWFTTAVPSPRSVPEGPGTPVFTIFSRLVNLYIASQERCSVQYLQMIQLTAGSEMFGIRSQCVILQPVWSHSYPSVAKNTIESPIVFCCCKNCDVLPAYQHFRNWIDSVLPQVVS